MQQIASKLLAFILALCFWLPAGAKTSEEVIRAFSKMYPEILVDARGSRGGNGDIAAAYLTLSDWIENYQLESKVTVLVDQNGKGRLLKLASANPKFLEKVEIRELGERSLNKEFSLYLVFANPSGTFRYKKDFGNLIHMSANSTMIVQTVLGNTENQNSLHPNAIIENNGQVYDWAPAGLAKNESGIYSDVVAQKFRPMALEEVRSTLLSDFSKVEDQFSRESLQTIVSGKSLQGAKVGLVYGISSDQTRKQFFSYLHGLASDQEKAHVLFTPSAFRAENLKDEDLKSKITFITSTDQIPAIAEPGHIYVIETKTLPHEVFVGMTALSMKNGVTPVGAGDGFLSAAIELGEPFVLTQVPWNRRNIQRVSELLEELAIEYRIGSADMTFLRNLLSRNFTGSDFRTAAALRRFAPLFRKLNERITHISDRMMEVAVAAPSLHNVKNIPKINDLVLQTSILKGGRPSQSQIHDSTGLHLDSTVEANVAPRILTPTCEALFHKGRN